MNSLNAIDIAKWFIIFNEMKMMEDGADQISNLKLQKLLYYAQGSYLALKNKALFSENILAWDHGPVVKEVYDAFKSYKGNGITLREDDEFNFNSIDNDTSQILEQVYDVFGKYSAWGLRNMTHNETPWKSTLKNEVITHPIIKKYFKENYVEN